jgi:hypothetical protein
VPGCPEWQICAFSGEGARARDCYSTVPEGEGVTPSGKEQR